MRLDGLRHSVEPGNQQGTQELGWADCMVRADHAIRRHWLRVCCACSCCWRDWFANAVPSAPVAGSARAEAPAPKVREKGGPPVAWPVTLRRIRAWLTPWACLQRCWHAWSLAPPPALQALLDAVALARPLDLYLREEQTTAKRLAGAGVVFG